MRIKDIIEEFLSIFLTIALFLLMLPVILAGFIMQLIICAFTNGMKLYDDFSDVRITVFVRYFRATTRRC